MISSDWSMRKSNEIDLKTEFKENKKFRLNFICFHRFEMIGKNESFRLITIECGVPIRLFIIIHEKHIRTFIICCSVCEICSKER